MPFLLNVTSAALLGIAATAAASDMLPELTTAAAAPAAAVLLRRAGGLRDRAGWLALGGCVGVTAVVARGRGRLGRYVGEGATPLQQRGHIRPRRPSAAVPRRGEHAQKWALRVCLEIPTNAHSAGFVFCDAQPSQMRVRKV